MLVGVIIAFLIYQQGEKEVAASEALSNVSVGQLTGASRQADNAEAYLRVAAMYPKSSAGARAVLLAAGSLFTERKYAEAKTQFERFTHDYPDSPFMGEARLGVAACLDAEGNTADAVAAYKDLIDRHPTDVVVPQAKFALARLYEAQHKPEQARDLYEDVERSDPYGSFGNEAGMRVEELNEKYPKQAAPLAPMPTNTVPFKLQQR